jgi:hypothetical protein
VVNRLAELGNPVIKPRLWIDPDVGETIQESGLGLTPQGVLGKAVSVATA